MKNQPQYDNQAMKSIPACGKMKAFRTLGNSCKLILTYIILKLFQYDSLSDLNQVLV